MSKAVGIDLGTTYSAVAILQSDGKPIILSNSEGQNITPSVVLFPATNSGEEPLVGEMAKHSVATSPLDVVQFVKRQMGDPNWRFESTNGNSYSSEEIAAIILKRLKADAELALGETVTDVVITVPAYFDDARRMATKHAGRIAGLNVLRVLNEPTAAALSYGLDVAAAGTVIVYDLGGGTFDVTVMKISNGEFEVLGTDGNRNLGGFDFDNRIAEYIFVQLENEGITDAADKPELVAEIREKSELAKKSLTTVAQATIILSINGRQFRIKISRDQFEDMTADLLKQTQELTEIVLQEAGLTWNNIDHLLLVGGSTRMPMVRKMMESISGKQASREINPDEAVALGAAIQAAITSSEAVGEELALYQGQKLVVADVTSQALGVIMLNDMQQEENFVVIPRNATIPTKGTQEAVTISENQTRINVRVTQGDDRDVSYVSVIGSKELTIPPYPKGAPFSIAYAYDIDQTVFVEVFDRTTNKSVGTFEIDRLQNMNENEVQSAIKKMSQIHLDYAKGDKY